MTDKRDKEGMNGVPKLKIIFVMSIRKILFWKIIATFHKQIYTEDEFVVSKE